MNADMVLNVTSMAVPMGLPELKHTYAGPTDFMSSLYGNGYDKCGPLAYHVLNADGLEEFDLDLFSSSFLEKTYNSDEITFSLESWPTGLDLHANFTLMIELEQYPTATKFYVPVNLTYRECFPTDFSGPDILPQELSVGGEGFEIDVGFN